MMKLAAIPIALLLLCSIADATAGDGRLVYTQICRACHDTGVAGAPVLGDKTAWSPRIQGGVDTLLQSALRGKGGMPPKGGNAGLTDEQIRDAVEYMVAQVR
ncbi:cytochrome c, class I [Azoarcus sp. KH32C]|nr:cytochrome c, class I [Azoarcus sp. KH32C]